MSRVLPEALELEKKLLSALMLKNGEIIPEVSNELPADAFYRKENRLIYKAIISLYERDSQIEPMLIEDELIRRKNLEIVENKYIFKLIDLEFTTARALTYAKIINEKYRRRRLIEVSEGIIESAYDEGFDFKELLEKAESEILSVDSARNSNMPVRVDAVIAQVLKEIMAVRENPELIQGVKSGFRDLDRVLNGFHKSDLILLAARPSMGKTALALNIATNVVHMGKTVLIFSLEMSHSQLGHRLLSTASKVDSFHLNTGNISDEEMANLIAESENLSDLKLYLDEANKMGILDLKSKARRLKHKIGLDLVIIDYLQLMDGPKTENRQQEIAAISRGLKSLAKELDVPILALSQLSRGVEMRAEKKPQLSDLRESGSLEQDADIVLFLYRDEYYNRDEKDDSKNIAELIIAKNRNGPTTTVHLQFRSEIQKFSDLTRAEYN